MSKSTELFKKLLDADGQTGREDVLRGLFPRTSEEQITIIAQSLEYTINNYKAGLKDVKGATTDMLAQRLGEAFATVWLNSGMEDIVDEGIHISQIGAGISLLTAFKGFLGLASLRVSRYTDITIEEQTTNYYKNLNEGRGLDRVEDKNLEQKVEVVEKEL